MVGPAVAATCAWLQEGLGNPSGAHSVARRARTVVEDARDVVARFLGVRPGEVVFTSGGTEADNLAVLGPLAAARRGAVVISAVEHPAVTAAAAASGRPVRTVAVTADGTVAVERLRDALGGEVAVVSIQTANHETGCVQDIPGLAARVHKWAPGAVFHTDAVQAAPWLDLTEATAGADLVSVSGHKIGGPQGIGALGVRNDVVVAPQVHGGGQERQRRSGTPPVAAIAGLGAAVEELGRCRSQAAADVARRRDLLAGLITSTVPGAVRTDGGPRVLPGHCHFRFPGLESEALLFLLDRAGVCASAGAACASGAVEPSPVLMAMGVPKPEAASCLRLTLGPTTTDDDVRWAAAAVASAVEALRS